MGLKPIPGVTPVPVRAIICGLLGTLSATTTTAVLEMAAAGL